MECDSFLAKWEESWCFISLLFISVANTAAGSCGIVGGVFCCHLHEGERGQKHTHRCSGWRWYKLIFLLPFRRSYIKLCCIWSHRWDHCFLPKKCLLADGWDVGSFANLWLWPVEPFLTPLGTWCGFLLDALLAASVSKRSTRPWATEPSSSSTSAVSQRETITKKWFGKRLWVTVSRRLFADLVLFLPLAIICIMRHS